MDGISFSAPPRPAAQQVFDSMVAVGAEWVAVVPYAYGPGEDGRLYWQDATWQWWGESEQGIREQVRMAKAAGLQVMVKPHLWLEYGAFTGTYEAHDRPAFEASYRDYLLTYARLAEEEAVALLCIGTELQRSIAKSPPFWSSLIDTLRAVYSGKLTYAANWDEVAHVPFWSALDLIGVNGYFPLTTAATNRVDPIIAGWKQHTDMLASLAQEHARPILFTEVGYTCAANCTVSPWQEDRAGAPDESAQAAAYAAFFQVMHQQPWYAGCFIWKWFADENTHREQRVIDFSPQGREAMGALRKAFAGE